MSDFTPIATESQFYTELINRFFHPKSYFIICVRKYLDNPILIIHNPALSITQIISQLIDYLNKSKSPAKDLNEITQIKSFENIYTNLESHLIRYDLRSLEQLPLKKAIQNVALYFLKDIYQILLNNETSRITLTKYLDIKMKLRDLLNGSNGKHVKKNSNDLDKQHNNVTSNVNDERLLATFSNLSEKTSAESNLKDTMVDSVNDLEEFFEKQVAQLLQPLAIFSNKPSELYTDSDFIKQIQESFSQIQELAMYHGYEELEAISGGIAQLMLTVISMKQPINQQIMGLIYDAKAAIEKYIFHHQRIDNLKNLLNNIDRCILQLNQSVTTNENRSHEQNSLPGPEKENIGSFEINTSYNNFHESSLTSIQKKNSPSIFSGLNCQNNHSENINELNEPSEDDEELLKLIQDVNLNQESSLPKNLAEIEAFEEIENAEPQILPSAENNSQQNDQDQTVNFDESTNQIFQREAVLYFKILSSAIAQLKNEEKVQSALEDIELASSSLKQLAQKFAMEKLALLPELIESISILANKHIIKLPSSILQGIEDGVNLLKEFDLNDIDHRSKFMSILTLLKEYYSKTLSTSKKISVAS